MTNPEQNPVVGRMHPRDRREDADRLALLARTTKEEVASRRRERLEHSAERKTRDFTVGSRGGVRIPIRRVKGGYKWGSKGKVYRNRKDAERQAAAAYASGYKKSMSWFNVLKIGGEDFGTDKVSDDFYGETHKIKTDYFYHKPSIRAFTRPHFEAQVLGKKGQGAVGNLQDIRSQIRIENANPNTLFYGFTDPENNAHVISFRLIGKDTELTGSSPLEIFRGQNPTPAKFGHKNGTILFDSIYPTKGMDRIDSLKNARFYPIWGMGDGTRLKQVRKENEGKDKSIGRTDVVREIKQPTSGLTPSESQELAELMKKQRNASKKRIFDKAYDEREARIRELKKKRDG